MLTAAQVSAVVVTRGDVDVMEILNNLADAGFAEVILWQNGQMVWDATGAEPVALADAPDLKVYGRYAAIEHCKSDYIYVQDDDCIVPALDLIAWADTHWNELLEDDVTPVSEAIISNMPHSRWADYPDSCLVGWGAIFPRHKPIVALARFLAGALGGDTDFPHYLRTCDVVFTTLIPHVKVDVGFHHLPWAEDPQRAMFKQPGHKTERDAMLELARRVRDARKETQ